MTEIVARWNILWLFFIYTTTSCLEKATTFPPPAANLDFTGNSPCALTKKGVILTHKWRKVVQDGVKWRGGKPACSWANTVIALIPKVA